MGLDKTSTTTLILVSLLAVLGGELGGRRINLGHIIALYSASLIYQYWSTTDLNHFTAFREHKDAQIDRLDPRNQYLYLTNNMDLLDLMTLALPFRDTNQRLFEEMLAATDAFCQSLAVIQTPATLYPVQEFHTLKWRKRELLNKFHALRLDLDSNEPTYLTLHQVLLDRIRVYVNEKTQTLSSNLHQEQEKKPVHIFTNMITSGSFHKPEAFDEFSANSDSLTERNYQFF